MSRKDDLPDGESEILPDGLICRRRADLLARLDRLRPCRDEPLGENNALIRNTSLRAGGKNDFEPGEID